MLTLCDCFFPGIGGSSCNVQLICLKHLGIDQNLESKREMEYTPFGVEFISGVCAEQLMMPDWTGGLGSQS